MQVGVGTGHAPYETYLDISNWLMLQCAHDVDVLTF